jgi:hypothetical protein
MSRVLAALLAVAVLLNSSTIRAADFYVSPQGNDAQPGTLERPFRSLARAQAAVRTMKAANKGNMPEGGITVWLRGGVYLLPKTFVLGPEDSGQQDRPMIYRAYGNEQPVLSGGRILGGWKKLQDNPPNLPACAKGKVWSASVPEAKDAKEDFRQLWLNGKRLPRARWPNSNRVPQPAKEPNDAKASGDSYYAHQALPGELQFQVVDISSPPADALKPGSSQNRWRKELSRAWRTAQFSANDLKAFPGEKLPNDLGHGTAELFSKNIGQWAVMRIPVESVEGSRLKTSVPMGYVSYYWSEMRLMACGMGHLENALSLLDQPGEWYLDQKAGVVYYMPAESEDPNAERFVAPKLEQLIRLRGTSHTPIQFVELRGLRIEHAQWVMPRSGYRPILGGLYGTQSTPLVFSPSMPLGDAPIKVGSVRSRDEYPEFYLPSAVDLLYAKQCSIELCRVAHVGASGIGLGEGCRRNRIVGCEVYDAGGNGIHAGLAHGPICGEDFAWKCREDEPQANEIVNCYVHHTGESDWGTYGILSSYCRGNRIAHNLVEQQPYSGIAACYTFFAFPSGRDEEIAVEYNHVHHVLQRLFDGGGIYTKDGVSAASVLRGNLIHDVGGRTYANNGIFLDDRSYGFHIEDNVIRGVTIPIRFNGTTKEKFTWGKNYLDGKDGPSELSRKVGLQEPYRSLLLGK